MIKGFENLSCRHCMFLDEVGTYLRTSKTNDIELALQNEHLRRYSALCPNKGDIALAGRAS